MSRYEVDNLYYKDQDHKKRLLELLLRDNTNSEDLERLSLFYLVSSSEDIYRKFNGYLYNFQDRWIILEGLSKVDLSSSQRKLIHLGLNLYNNYYDEEERMTVLDLLSGLDHDNFEVAIEGIRIRLS